MVLAPQVFISSTISDLKQVRQDLATVISQMGLEPIKSEDPSFPADPNKDTLNICLQNIRDHADVMILIIGDKYGWVPDDSDKSITHQEYLCAKAKGIPIYVFVYRSLITILPIWKANPDTDFSSSVDDVRVLDLINSIRNIDKTWTFEFENADNISSTFRKQFSIHLGKSLRFFSLLEGAANNWMQRLSPEAYQYAVGRPKGWEYLLFIQQLIDQIAASSSLRLRHKFQITYSKSTIQTPQELISFLKIAAEEVKQLLKNFRIVYNEVLPKAFGLPGVAGDAESIAFAANEICEVYRRALHWSDGVRACASVQGAEGLVMEFSKLIDGFVSPIENFGPFAKQEILKGIASSSKDNQVNAELVLKFEPMSLTDYYRLLSEFARSLGVEFTIENDEVSDL